MSESTTPGDYTIAQLTEWAETADPADVQAALEAEQNDKARVGAVAALEAALSGGESVEGQATTSRTKDWIGRALVAPGTNGLDFLGRAILAGDKDYLGRALVP